MQTTSPSTITPDAKQSARHFFQEEGYFLAPPVLSADLIARVNKRIDAILAGEYETGIPPVSRNFPPGQGGDKLQKIDNTHLSDRTILEAITCPAIGEWAAAITGAKMVQVFCTQMLVKPRGTSDAVNVGWHQDLEYWSKTIDGELFTAWLAISDVTANSGPMRFVRRSNHWGLLESGDFFSGNMDETKTRMQKKHGDGAWEEVPGILKPGAVSFHHGLTIHGSTSNTEAWPRRSFAIHMRTEKSAIVEGVDPKSVGWLNDLNDDVASPVIYREDA